MSLSVNGIKQTYTLKELIQELESRKEWFESNFDFNDETIERHVAVRNLEMFGRYKHFDSLICQLDRGIFLTHIKTKSAKIPLVLL